MYGGIGAVCSGLFLISGRGAPLLPQSLILRHPPRARMFFVSAAERSAAAGILQEVKRQETGDDSETLRPRRRRHLTCNEGSGETSPDTTPKSSAGRKSKEVAKPLPLLLSPASTPPVRRPRQRPLLNQRTRRTSTTRILQPAPSAARPNVFVSAAERSAAAGILPYTRQLKLAELREARINIRQDRV